ncbi:MAG TPA: ADP-glyceromanno-heptose 6-epimerase [Gammaproteobacteria bacterium]|nr:ADP-glyceromanno-heptose 6-epimerase [Gammaproteobacteria bacterium]
MIVVTGGAGFIGSNLVHALNARGISDILVVDDLADGHKFTNIAAAAIRDYEDRDRFLAAVEDERFAGRIEAIFHQGACSDTTEWDGRYLMDVNYRYSRVLLEFAIARGVPFYYASSAAVYGAAAGFSESPENERPINLYGYSKTLFDRYVRRRLPQARSPVAGLRYFNVYGPGEAHKGRMASVAWHFHRQIVESGRCRLFAASGGYGDGEQRRDFVYVDDVVAINLWFLDHPECSGIYNAGSGRSQSFNDVARAVIAHHGRGQIEYVPFPADLEGSYQNFTEADLSRLRACGCTLPFRAVESGVADYLGRLGDG